MFVSEFTDGVEVDQVLLVRSAETRSKRDGGQYLRLTLADRTGSVTANVWDDAAAVARVARAGVAVRVIGCYQVSSRFGAELRLRTVSEPAPGSFDEADLRDRPPHTIEHMEAGLRELVATIQDRDLRRLCDRFFGAGSAAWRRYADAPAAKFFHQAYRHGLLEHSLSVAQAVSAISATFPGIDRDVAVTGALLHDIGKLEAYAMADPPGPAIDMTDAGKLEGEIPLGYYAVRRAIEEIDGFAADTAQAVLHIILSHHGSLEYGSPVVPCTREATLVHFCDNLGGRLGSFDRLEKELLAGESWSRFDRAIGSGAYFARPMTGDRDAREAA